MLDMAADYVNKKGWSVDDALRHVHMSTFGLDGDENDKGKIPRISYWVAEDDSDTHVGISRVRVNGPSSLKIEYIRTNTGKIVDSWTLTKDNSIYPLGEEEL